MVIEERHIKKARTEHACLNVKEHVIKKGESYWAQYARLDRHSKPFWWALCETCKEAIDALY